MELSTANRIYSNSNGYSKKELRDCIKTLNEACQPVGVNNLQFMALLDARDKLNRLGGK